jgi:hypothetical protein
MESQRVVELIMKLAERTKQAKIDWQVTPRPNEYIAGFSDYSIGIVATEINDQGGVYFSIKIYDITGSLIEEIYDDIERETLLLSGTLREIYEQARRQALGLDAAISSIIRQLDSIDLQDEDIPF